MNYAMYAEWIKDRVEDLVRFGVPRVEAESLMQHVELGGISAEADARGADQFLLDLRRIGTSAMATRRGITEQAIRKQRNKLLNRNPELRAQLRK